jgi:NADH-quinone oxidoreductase subunit J
MTDGALLSGLSGWLFAIFAVVAVIGAICVILARNPVHSALFLLLTFLCVAGIFFLEEAEFVGAVQILVYAGGIMVLFLFVIMLVNVQRLGHSDPYHRQIVGAAVVAFLLNVLFDAFLVIHPVEPGAAFDPAAFRNVGGRLAGNTQAVASSLYQDYLLPFEIASIFLLVAMIGAVVLGRRSVERMD